MKFNKHLRFNESFYFCGIYKITRYVQQDVNKSKPYYQAYVHNGSAWGDYVDRSKQHNKYLTLKDCKSLCKEHEDNNGKASSINLKSALKSQTLFLNQH